MLGSHQGGFQLLLQPLSSCGFRLPGERLSIFSCFSALQMTFRCLFMRHSFLSVSQLRNPTLPSPLLPLPCSLALSWKGTLNVFQVSAPYLRAALWQAAAPGATQPINPTPALPGPCPHKYAGNGCNLFYSCPVIDEWRVELVEWCGFTARTYYGLKFSSYLPSHFFFHSFCKCILTSLQAS